MTNKIVFCFSFVILFILTAEVKCKFEKMRFFLTKYEVTKVEHVESRTVPKFLELEEGEKSIRIKAFGKTFIVDLVFYYQRSDTEVTYTSKQINSSDSYIPSLYLTYHGYVRNVKDSFALGFISKNVPFRGYIVTDEVYCVEPYGKSDSVIVYRFKDVIVPGCSQNGGGDTLDCSETQYYTPWKANRPPTRQILTRSYSLFYDKHLEDFYRRHAKKSNAYIADKNKDGKSENEEQRAKEDDYDYYEMEEQNVERTTIVGRPKESSTEYRSGETADSPSGFKEMCKNYTRPKSHTGRRANPFTEIPDEMKNEKQEHKIVARNTDKDNKDGEKFEKDEDHLKNKNYPENRLEHSKTANKNYNIRDSNGSMFALTDDIDSASWEESAYEENMNLANNEETIQSNKQSEEPIVKELIEADMAEICNVQILVDESFRERFDFSDEAIMKDIFTQFTLLNKIFEKVPLMKRGKHLHLIFSVESIALYGDEIFSPFTSNANLEYFTKVHEASRSSCLSVGLVNRYLNSGQFFDGYIPEAGGGACSSKGNTLIIGHGNANTPAPMALFFAALVRGITRAQGANDKDSQCAEGTHPNPMQVLQDYIKAKEIAPTEESSIFTSCNIKEIERALRTAACFQKVEQPLCGNAILDPGEECDCGPIFFCNRIDPCCNPHGHFQGKKSRNEKSSIKGCTLVKGAKCSTMQECCSACQVDTTKRVCSSGPGVCDIAICDAESANCPSAVEASNGMICSTFNETMAEPLICQNGECDQLLCSGFGLTPCTCGFGSGKDCGYCCMKDGRCKAAGADLQLIANRDFFLPDGVECMGGTCLDGECTSLHGEHFTLKKPPRFPEEANSCYKPSPALKYFVNILLSLLAFHLL